MTLSNIKTGMGFIGNLEEARSKNQLKEMKGEIKQIEEKLVRRE